MLMKPKNGARDTGEVVALVAVRSRSNPRRPRLSTEAEDRLERIEQESAECYADIELLTHRFTQLAIHIGNGDESAPDGDLMIEDTGVVRLEELRSKIER